MSSQLRKSEAELMTEAKLLDSTDLLIQSSVVVICSLPSPLLLELVGFLPFAEVLWFLLMNLIQCYAFSSRLTLPSGMLFLPFLHFLAVELDRVG